MNKYLGPIWIGLILLGLCFFGDVFDAFGFLVVALIICYFSSKRNLPFWPQVFLYGAATLVSVSFLNRVKGYPDDEMAPYLAIFAFFVFQISLVLCLVFRKVSMKVGLVVLLLIHLPFIEALSLTSRSLTAQYLVQDKESLPKPFLFTYLGLQKARGIGWRVSSNDNHLIFLVREYQRYGTQYEYTQTFELLLSEGSMDSQKLNIPLLLRFMVYL